MWVSALRHARVGLGDGPMTPPTLHQLQEDLEAKGDDAQRLELVERARRFKRAWVEMAEGLTLVNNSKAYERWGYGDIYEYAEKELRIRKPTVQKLTNSYMAVRRHAPKVLERDGVEHSMPSLEAVDYFVKASEGEGVSEKARRGDVLSELKAAIFDDVRPLAAVRKEFGPVLFEKKASERERELLEKTRVAARRLLGLLRNVDSVPAREKDAAVTAVEALEARITTLLPAERKAVSEAAAGAA